MGSDQKKDSMKEWFNAFEIRLTNTLTTSLTNKINDSETKILNQIEQKFSNLDERLGKVENAMVQVNNNTININTITGVVNSNSSDIVDMRAELSALATETQSIRDGMSEQKRMFVEKVEDLTNRSLRKNIVIRGIPEDPNEKTWEDTCNVVKKAIAEVTGADVDNYENVFERIHRGKKSNDPKKKDKPRPIFAVLFDWNDIQRLSKELRDAPPNNIYIDQQYGAITTYRRNEAFKKRKTLKEAKTIAGGFVKFPAKLFVRYGSDSSNVFCEDFSNIPIPDEILNQALAS